MKIKVKRIIKVLSSFAVIAMVLIATVAMPVLAADDGIYSLADLVVNTRVEDDEIIVSYDPAVKDIVPYMQAYKNGTLFTSGSTNSFLIRSQDQGNYSINFSIFGSAVSQSMKTGFVDISDWNGSAAYSLQLQFEIDTGVFGVDGGGRFSANVDVWFFDENKDFLSRFVSETQNYSFTGDVGQHLFIFRTDVKIPDGVTYMAVRTRTSVYADYLDETRGIDIQLVDPIFVSTMSSVIHNSETMDAIKKNIADMSNKLQGGLADLDESINKGNQQVVDKIDEAMNGRDEWNNQAQDDSQLQESIDNDINDAIVDIDKNSDPFSVLPDTAKQPADLDLYVQDWVWTDGWTSVLEIFKPILSDGNFTAILFMVVAFINISVLLLGR